MSYQEWIRVVPLFVAIAASLARASDRPIIIGVLEDNSGHYAGDSSYRSVRAVIEKKGDVWQAFPNDCRDQDCLRKITKVYPAEVKWTIAFDGKNIGQVTSRTPNDFKWYSDVGQQEITSKGPVPTIGARSSEFGGYTGARVYRPLIAISEPYFKDPETWKPFVASPELTRVLQQAFSKKFPNLCHSIETDGDKLEPLHYRNEDIKLVKAYASISGWVLARLHLDAIDCKDIEAGSDIDDPWFAFDGKKSITYLDSGMWLLDAGDYDNDGRSEIIFSIDRENEGGYEIYYKDFRQHTTFKFNYH